eukprot:4451477-Alexandrium_andersonii.AAC.1
MSLAHAQGHSLIQVECCPVSTIAKVHGAFNLRSKELQAPQSHCVWIIRDGPRRRVAGLRWHC